MSNLTWDYTIASAAAGSDFYQLAEFADSERVRLHLGAALGMCNDSYLIDNVRYIAGRSLQVIYRVAGESVVTVQFMQPGTSGSAFASALAAARRPGLVHHLAAWDAVAWVFPEDPGLPGIPDVLRQSAKLLAIDCAEMAGRVLSYLPGERCAVHCCPTAGGQGLVAKLRSSRGMEESHLLVCQLWGRPSRRFRMPEPIAADEALGARWERFVPGQRLEAALAHASAATLLGDVAAGLVELHAIPLPGIPAQEPAKILRQIDKVLRRIGATLPNLIAPAEALARALAASSSNLPACQVATLHGDLHTANVIVDDRGPVLIDLDSLVAGDPAFDLAMLGSRLVLSALNRGEPAAPSLRMAASLPSWYTAAGGRPIDDYVYAWYVAALLLGRQIKTCLRHSAPITGRIAPQLLALAHALLERGSVTSAHDVFS